MSRTLLTGLSALIVAAGFTTLRAMPVAAAGAPKALVSCTVCHDVSAAKKKMVGPPLAGVFNRKPSIAGVPFAKWDAASLDKWLTNPQAVKASSSMTFKVADPGARKAAIAALQTLK
jgi:cytochrome c2